jgi:hypothetical protein
MDSTANNSSQEICPSCNREDAIRPKLLLIDAAWKPVSGVDPRLAYFADLRVDDVRPENLDGPLREQFVRGLFCDRCGKGFVSETTLKSERRRYR